AALETALWCLEHVARGLIALGVTANAITVSSVFLAGIAGALLCFGQFGWAAVAMVAASLGDALDGLVARRTGTASVAGALLDASVDRYEEFFFLGGLAIYFHESTGALALTLLAMAGSFMVSYGSAKAEALGVPVPPGAMRRAERAVFLCVGVASMPVYTWLTRGSALPSWAAEAPLFAALALVGVGANVSAIRRLRFLARGKAPVKLAIVRPMVVTVEPDELEPESDSDGQVVAAPHALRAP
ncbi:MAG TPA: CDP-alcohol phosphatidyltransferase family protein, partial [Polyangiaceae bacterium]|nr:CDP-alcohol phosphatidyltransferase family protein [Polyangiaceae bacterium]